MVVSVGGPGGGGIDYTFYINILTSDDRSITCLSERLYNPWYEISLRSLYLEGEWPCNVIGEAFPGSLYIRGRYTLLKAYSEVGLFIFKRMYITRRGGLVYPKQVPGTCTCIR